MKVAPKSSHQLIDAAWKAGIAVPGFNIPYIPMMEPVVRALRDTETFGLIMVARLEWIKFKAGGLSEIKQEYDRVKDERFTRLHLDHVPVIDEDDYRVDFMPIMRAAVELKYGSIMIDGSRLPFMENIAVTSEVVQLARGAGIAVEGELGMVLGHGEGPLPPYDELFDSGKGFTNPDEARTFVEETGVDWLSVAVGSTHGAVSKARKDEKKVEARLNIEHLERINQLAQIPLVLHGGTGIKKEYVIESIKHGIAKINVATALRQPYERAIGAGVGQAQQAVYEATLQVVKEDLEAAGSARILKP